MAKSLTHSYICNPMPFKLRGLEKLIFIWTNNIYLHAEITTKSFPPKSHGNFHFFWQSFSSLQSNDMSVSLQSEAVCTRHPLKRNILFCSSRFFSLYHFFPHPFIIYISPLYQLPAVGSTRQNFISFLPPPILSLSLCLKKDSLCFN